MRIDKLNNRNPESRVDARDKTPDLARDGYVRLDIAGKKNSDDQFSIGGDDTRKPRKGLSDGTAYLGPNIDYGDY